MIGSFSLYYPTSHIVCTLPIFWLTIPSIHSPDHRGYGHYTGVRTLQLLLKIVIFFISYNIKNQYLLYLTGSYVNTFRWYWGLKITNRNEKWTWGYGHYIIFRKFIIANVTIIWQNLNIRLIVVFFHIDNWNIYKQSHAYIVEITQYIHKEKTLWKSCQGKYEHL